MQFCKLISYDTKRVHAVGKLELDPSVLTLMVNWLGNKKSKNYYISSISPGALFYCFLRLMSLEQSKLFKTYQKTRHFSFQVSLWIDAHGENEKFFPAYVQILLPWRIDYMPCILFCVSMKQLKMLSENFFQTGLKTVSSRLT